MHRPLRWSQITCENKIVTLEAGTETFFRLGHTIEHQIKKHGTLPPKDFLFEMKRRVVPIDFFSWHIYCTEPQKLLNKAETVKTFLIEGGYENAENILNEWNYVAGWTDKFVYSIKAIHSIKSNLIINQGWVNCSF